MITIDEFKKHFKRDFNFITDQSDGDPMDYILDCDIEKAMEEMEALLPVNRFDEKALRLAQLYLTAHCLVGDIRRSNNGLASTFSFPVQSRSVGSVSESYGVPQTFLSNPAYSFYITTDFGLKYLALLYPRTRGNIGIAGGWTTP